MHCAKLRKRLCPYRLGIGAMRAVMDMGMSTIVYLLSSICISYDWQQFICFTYIIMGACRCAYSCIVPIQPNLIPHPQLPAPAADFCRLIPGHQLRQGERHCPAMLLFAGLQHRQATALDALSDSTNTGTVSDSARANTLRS